MRDYIWPDRISACAGAALAFMLQARAVVLRKAERVRPVNRPTTSQLRRESKDPGHETLPALQRTSRFRAHDESDEGGHSYPTARYLTRFD
jgi:hypothetical protein